MKNRNIVCFLSVSLLLFIMLIVACRPECKHGETAAEEIVVSGLEEAASRSPHAVCGKVDSLLPFIADSSLYYRAVTLKSKAKLFMSQIDSSALLLRDAESYCVRHPGSPETRRLHADVCNMWGNLYGRRAVYDSAVWAFNKAYEYASADGASRSLLNICVNLADSYVRVGRFDIGSYWYNYSLSVADSLQFPERERFPVYYGLAQVNMELHDFSMCDYYYDLASKFFDDMQPYEKHIYLNNRGNSYYFRQDYEEALKYFRRSLALTSGYPEMIFERNLTMVNLGEVFLLLNQTDSASVYLYGCHPFFESVQNASALYYIDTQLIELALKQGDVAKAKRMLRMTKHTESIEPNMIRIRNRYLEHYFAATGDYKRAYDYQRMNWRMDDSIRNERVKMRAAEIALKYKRDSTLMKQELFINQKENQVLELRQWLWGIVMLVVVMIVTSAAYLSYRRRQKEKEMWRMQTDITSLRLENIRNRISPHFIFNVLNREMNLHKKESQNLFELTKLIRRNLELTDKLAVTLSDELDFVKTFVSLESRSLGDEFEFQLRVDDGILLEHVMIPAMLLQIPVENAIKHALRLKEGFRLLRISVTAGEKEVVMTVTDNGGGYRLNSVSRGTGTGMKVITQTIQLLNFYNSRPIVMKISNVFLEECGTTGCQVLFKVPYNYSYTLKKNKGYDR